MVDLDQFTWSITEEVLGFCVAFKLKAPQKLTALIPQLPEGVALVSTDVVVGLEHVKELLAQTAEYWKREQFLARNRSIELLLRITAQSQISEAIRLSRIDTAIEIAMFGIQKDRDATRNAFDIFVRNVEGYTIDMQLLEVTARKKSALLKLHDLPGNCTIEKLRTFLEEESALLSIRK